MVLWSPPRKITLMRHCLSFILLKPETYLLSPYRIKATLMRRDSVFLFLKPYSLLSPCRVKITLVRDSAFLFLKRLKNISDSEKQLQICFPKQRCNAQVLCSKYQHSVTQAEQSSASVSISKNEKMLVAGVGEGWGENPITFQTLALVLKKNF